jgi:hypothetical protein
VFQATLFGLAALDPIESRRAIVFSFRRALLIAARIFALATSLGFTKNSRRLSSRITPSLSTRRLIRRMARSIFEFTTLTLTKRLSFS